MKLYAAPLDFDNVAAEFQVSRDFDEHVTDQARAAVDQFAASRRDARDLPLVTIDPPGSRDLDQAVYITSGTAGGYRVYYAIADVGAWLGGTGEEAPATVHAEAMARGQTIYLPDSPARLHPPVLSEDRASLLEGVDRPAVLFSFDLDTDGEVTDFFVERALVRSRARLDYDGVHEDLVHGRMNSAIRLLPEVGQLRQASALRREAISLRIPSQRVVEDADGRFELEIEPRHEVMDYNSEISLMAGMCAGQLMHSHGVGFLRTLPGASPEAEEEFRAEARALGFELGELSISEFLRGVDASSPRGMAVMREALRLLRGADYALLGRDEGQIHAGIGGYYAHVTAPLRRLIDRFGLEVCLAICAGTDVPEWVQADGEEAVASMRRSSQLASQVDKACLQLTEATVLEPWVGTNFSAVVLSSNAERETARLLVNEPPVIGQCVGAPEPGSETSVSLVTAEPEERAVRFAWPAD